MAEYSQNGYSAGDRSLIVTLTVPGTSVQLPVRRGPVGDLLVAAAARWHLEVEPLVIPGCWGYAYRQVRGSTTDLSNHASGTAIDVNAPQHPLGTEITANFTPAQIIAVRRIIADARGALRWGGDYTGRKDGMHLEAIADEDACAAALPFVNAPLISVASIAPTPHASEDVMAPIPLPVVDGRFRATCMAEAGSSSAVVEKAWVTFGATFGGAHFDVVALNANGTAMGPKGEKHVDLANNRRDLLEVPSGAVMVTIEGRALTAGAVPAAALVCQPK